MADQRTGRAWMALVSECKQTYPWVCHLCGQPIPRGVHRDHPLAYQADHLLAVSTHRYLKVDVTGLRPSHKQCNGYRSNRELSVELIEDITRRFASQQVPRPALAYFDPV